MPATLRRKPFKKQSNVIKDANVVAERQRPHPGHGALVSQFGSEEATDRSEPVLEGIDAAIRGMYRASGRGAVDPHPAQLHQTGLPGQAHDLDEQRPELRQVQLPELPQRPACREVASRQRPGTPRPPPGAARSCVNRTRRSSTRTPAPSPSSLDRMADDDDRRSRNARGTLAAARPDAPKGGQRRCLRLSHRRVERLMRAWRAEGAPGWAPGGANGHRQLTSAVPHPRQWRACSRRRASAFYGSAFKPGHYSRVSCDRYNDVPDS